MLVRNFGLDPLSPEQLAVIRDVRSRHPRFREAVLADARAHAAYRGERHQFRSRADTLVQIVRLMAQSDAFLAQAFYRLKARLQALGVPILPRIAHRLAVIIGQIAIGDPVVIQPGAYIVHGQVVIDGLTEIGAGVVIAPFTTIGLREGVVDGPKIGASVFVGTGARILGDLTIGDGARIGANCVVVRDIAAGTTVVGVPAREVDA